jgi:transposase InsO family protein
MDLFGPVAYLSIGGSKYGLVIVDDFSRFTWVFFLQNKSETQGTLKRFLRRAQNEFELKVKKIWSDNRSEFKNLQAKEYLEEEGIKHEFSAPYTPQQNGVVERKNRTLIDMARMMLGEYKTPERFWSEAVNLVLGRRQTRYPSLHDFASPSRRWSHQQNAPEQAKGADRTETYTDPFALGLQDEGFVEVYGSPTSSPP